MAARDLSVRFQVLIERLKVSEARILLRAIKHLEGAIRDVLGSGELHELSQIQFSRAMVLAEKKLEHLGLQILEEQRKAIESFVEIQTGIENRLWGKDNPLSLKDARLAAFETPLGIDGPDRGRNLDAYIENWWKNVRSSVFGALKRGAFERRSNSQLKKDLLGTKFAQYKDGLLDSLKRNAVSTSNTAIQHAFSSVREALMRRTETAVMWSAMFEKNVCARCRSLDGRIFKPGEGPRSPLHVACRCIMEPVQVDTETTRDTYYDWLKTQSLSVIEEALGKTRAQLFMNGGISASRFAELQLDRRFEPLTLNELRALAPSIFAQAGL